ncbi:MAG: RDD family protein [Bdellovibrionales bacterium]|nr:RDD family protein [Bdellovibrionales bacterium]
MPIPLQHFESAAPPQAEVIQFPVAERRALVDQSRALSRCLLRDRAIAHGVDAVILHGFSVYLSKMLAAVLARFAIPRIEPEAVEVFTRAVAFGQVRIWLASVVVFSCLYVTLGHHFYGRTLGKALLGLRVVSETGAYPDVRGSLRRWFGYFFTYGSFGLTWLTAFTQGESQTIHDRIGKTRVVRG